MQSNLISACYTVYAGPDQEPIEYRIPPMHMSRERMTELARKIMAREKGIVLTLEVEEWTNQK